MRNLKNIYVSLKRTWFLNPFSTKILILITSTLIASLEIITVNLITLQIFAEVDNVKNTLFNISIITGIFFTLKLFLNYLQFNIIYRCGTRIAEKIFIGLSNKIINPLFKTEKATDAITIVTHKINNLTTQQLTPMVQILTAIVVLSTFFLQIVYIHKLYTIFIILGIVIPLVFIASLLFIFTAKQSKIINNALENLTSSSLQAFEKSHSALVNGLGPFLYKAFKIDNSKLRQSQMLLIFYSSIPRVIFETMLFGLALLFVFSGGSVSIDSAGAIAVTGLLVYRSLPYLAAVMQNLMLISGNIDAFNSIYHQFKSSDSVKKATQRNTVSILSSMEFQNFQLPWVKYGQGFQGLSATVRIGEPLILFGESGCGKSTIMRMLMGERLVDCNLKILDRDNKQVMLEADHETIKENYAYFEPSFMLFTSSFVENITGKKEEEISVDESKRLFQVLEIVGLYSQYLEWKSSKNLLDCGLSTGQQMRVGLARSLYKDCLIYILDEPTSNLDSTISKKIADRIINFLSNKILVIATHEPFLWAGKNKIDCSFLNPIDMTHSDE
jgi:ABC-type transport system involved in cytochrome bd biosynthesis fused ATPase/permease subunit